MIGDAVLVTLLVVGYVANTLYAIARDKGWL